MVSWEDFSGQGGDASSSSIKAQLYDASGATVGGEFLVNTATLNYQTRPTITGLAGGGFVASWTDLSGLGGDANGASIKAQIFDATGGQLGGEFLVNTMTLGEQAFSTITGLTDGGFVVSWRDSSGQGGDASSNGVKAQLFDASGAKVGGEFLVNTATLNDQQAPAIAGLTNGDFVVTWIDNSAQGGDASSYGIKAQIFSVIDQNVAPVAAADHLSATEDTPVTFAASALLANDTDDNGDTLTITGVADATGGTAILNADGSVGFAPTANFDGTASFSYTVSDAKGGTAVGHAIVNVAAVNDAPTAVADTIAVDEGATTANLWAGLLSNDTDVDVGDVLSIVSVSGSSLGGTLVLNAALQSLTYTADAEILDLLATGATVDDSFTYTMRDAAGATSQATVSVTITGVGDGATILGTVKIDTLTGTAGEDTIRGDNGADIIRAGAGADWVYGENGDDRMFGEAGMDRLFGGNGDDRLDGGSGNDLLTGGLGRDTFVFGASSGADRITDFTVGQDLLLLVGGVALLSQSMQDVNSDGVADMVLTLNNGGSVGLLGVTGLSSVDLFG